MFKKNTLSKENIPFYVVLGLLLISFFILMSVFTFQTILKNEAMVEQFAGSSLNGMQTKASYPNWSVNAVMDSSWQKQFETWLVEKIPVRKIFIRLQNQFFHTVFGKSYMYSSTLIIGKNNYLYEDAYLADYCNPNHHVASEEKFTRWAQNLQLMSDYFKARGQQFIYVITPSKAAYFPEYIPDNYKCSKDATRPNYYQALKALKTVRVNYVDASEFMLNSKAQYGELLFPRGGTHWTNLGTALSLNEILTKLGSPNSLQFSYEVTHEPHGTDRDLLKLENLLFPDENYVVPALSFQAPAKLPTDTIAIIGGSFCHQIAELLSQGNAFQQIDHYYYYSINHARYVPGKEVEIRDTVSPGAFDTLFSAGTVLLEENESNLDSVHGKYLLGKILEATLD